MPRSNEFQRERIMARDVSMNFSFLGMLATVSLENGEEEEEKEEEGEEVEGKKKKSAVR